MLSSEAVFREREQRAFTRKCTGNEAICSLGSEMNGATHSTFSTNVKFGVEISLPEIKEKLQRAMVRCRHLVPAMACVLSLLAPIREFQLKYVVPTSSEDALEWAKKVVVIHDDAKSFQEAHDTMAETVWWKASDGRYAHELHVHPSSKSKQSWIFTLSAHHGHIDARSAWMILEKVLTFLTDEIECLAPPLSSLQWGEETRRLSPPPELARSVMENNGLPDEFPAVTMPPPPPAGFAPWNYPYKTLEGTNSSLSTNKLCLTKEETARFHAACTAHNRTVTQVITALSCLVNAECALRIAGEDDALYQETVSGFKTATHYQTSWNAVNVRGLLPEGYQSLEAEYGTPMNCVDGFPLAFSLEPFRRMLKVNEASRTVSRMIDERLFWDESVKDVADAWKRQSRLYEAYQKRAATFTVISALPADELSKYPRNLIAPPLASCGDLTRLNIMEQFRPCSGNEILIVEDIDVTTRYAQPAWAWNFLQYDGLFRARCYTSAKHSTQKQIDDCTAIAKEWFDRLFNV